MVNFKQIPGQAFDVVKGFSEKAFTAVKDNGAVRKTTKIVKAHPWAAGAVAGLIVTGIAAATIFTVLHLRKRGSQDNASTDSSGNDSSASETGSPDTETTATDSEQIENPLPSETGSEQTENPGSETTATESSQVENPQSSETDSGQTENPNAEQTTNPDSATTATDPEETENPQSTETDSNQTESSDSESTASDSEGTEDLDPATPPLSPRRAALSDNEDPMSSPYAIPHAVINALPAKETILAKAHSAYSVTAGATSNAKNGLMTRAQKTYEVAGNAWSSARGGAAFLTQRLKDGITTELSDMARFFTSSAQLSTNSEGESEESSIELISDNETGSRSETEQTGSDGESSASSYSPRQRDPLAAPQTLSRSTSLEDISRKTPQLKRTTSLTDLNSASPEQLKEAAQKVEEAHQDSIKAAQQNFLNNAEAMRQARVEKLDQPVQPTLENPVEEAEAVTPGPIAQENNTAFRFERPQQEELTV